MRLPVRIFEDRYKQLYEDALKEGGAFGIALIREGPEVGGPATPFDVGTLVEIESVDYRGENLFVLCKGTQRFRIRELRRERPYLMGRIEVLEDFPVSPDQHELAVHGLEVLFQQYLQGLRSVAKALGGDLVIPEVPQGQGPRETAYGIAFTLPLEPNAKQALLEETSLTAFVERLRHHLETELGFMQIEDEEPSA